MPANSDTVLPCVIDNRDFMHLGTRPPTFLWGECYLAYSSLQFLKYCPLLLSKSIVRLHLASVEAEQGQ